MTKEEFGVYDHETEVYEGITNRDPFSDNPDPRLIAQVQLIVSMRTYDALMALLARHSKSAADGLDKLHREGKIIGGLPMLDLTVEDESN